MSAQTPRRRFLKALAAGAAVPLLPASALAQEEPREPAPPDAAAALTAVARSRCRWLTDAHAKEVRQDIARNLRLADALRRAQPAVTDEPAFVFAADVPEGG